MTTPTILKRPSEHNKMQGYLNRVHWDAGNKAALFSFTEMRSIGSGTSKRTEYINFSVRFWGRDAEFLAFLLTHKASEEKAGRKYPLSILMDARVASWEKPTGKMVGANGNVKETNTVTYYTGKNSQFINGKYELLADSKDHKTQEELSAQMA